MSKELSKQIEEIEQVIWEEFTIESSPYDNPIWVRKATKRISQAVQEALHSAIKEIEGIQKYYDGIDGIDTAEEYESGPTSCYYPETAYIRLDDAIAILKRLDINPEKYLLIKDSTKEER